MKRLGFTLSRCASPTFADYAAGMWNRRLVEPVVLDNGEVLRTLRDARKFVAALPEDHQQYRKWRILADCLFSAASTGRAEVIATATEQLRHALITAPLPPRRLIDSLQKNAPQSADEDAEAEMIEIPDGAYVHIFSSVSEDDLHGLTLKRSGDNLPAEKGPWTHFTDIVINEGQFVPRVGVEDEDFEKKALTALRIHGFYLIKARIILPLKRHQ